MWQLSVLSALIVMSFCPAETQDTGCGRYGPHAVGEDGQIDFQNPVAQPNELPWMVMIFKRNLEQQENEGYGKGIHLYDGVLIHPRVVLASIYSVWGTKPIDLQIVAGNHGTTSNGRSNRQYQFVSDVLIHEYEKPGELQHLVAILILSNPFEITESVGVMCVPREDDNYDRLRCIVSGQSSDNFGLRGIKLNRVGVSIISHDECRASYDDYNNNHDSEMLLFRDSICAGSKEHPKMYESNRGSPLICPLVNDSSRYVLVGFHISPLERKTDDYYLPSQFADVLASRDWIDNKMSANGLDSSKYTIISN